MLESDSTASVVAQDEPGSDSVFDFLYHDARRVGSFLAQFDDSGHLQQIKQTEAVAKTSGNKTTVSGATGIPVVAQGQIASDRTSGKEGREGTERVYDPLWTNTRTLLDFLDSRGMIHRDISKARIGQFVLISGSLTILDLTILKGLWEIPHVNIGFIKGPANSIFNAKGVAASDAGYELLLNIFKALPHSVHAGLTDEQKRLVWSTLKEENMVVSSSDLLLKNGVVVSGQWSMLGILDAFPDDMSTDSNAASLTDSPFSEILGSLAPFLRQLGRPQQAYGMTPLLIFRQVSAIS